MINIERHHDNLNRRIDWDRALSLCSEGELRALEERATEVYAESAYRGIRAFGEVLNLQIQRTRALRRADDARIDAQAWAINELEFRSEPVDPVGDVEGLPKWSDISEAPC